MTKKEPLLSICIPTYNREKYLKRLLDSIVCQKEFRDTDNVEIIVDDGPSSDNTESMVKEYIKRYWNKIKYYRNPIRIWMCPAFLEALNFWTGKYLWLFGSDDSMNKTSLWNILTIINSSPRIIYFRRKTIKFWDEIFDGWKPKVISFKWMTEFCEYLWDKTELTFHDKDVFFTFISVLCINKDYYHNSYKNLINNIWYSEHELKKNYFNFSIIALSNIKTKDIVSIVLNPICVYCETNKIWWIPNKKISQDLRHLTKYISCNYPISFKCKIFFKKLNFNWYLWCESKVYRLFINILKRLKLYEFLWKFWRKYILWNK